MKKAATQDIHKLSTAAPAEPIVCYGCGAELAPAAVTRIEVKVGKERIKQPMCRTCAINHTARLTLGGAYVEGTMRFAPNRAARRHPKPEPVVKPAKTRRATRGERRAAKKAVAAKQSKKEAA